MKTLDKFNMYPGNDMILSEVITKKGLVRVSRWIEIKCNRNPNKTNHLWDYVEDERGYRPWNDKFDNSSLHLDYFKYDGRTYAINQFIAIGSIADCLGHHMGYIENGEEFYLWGYDSENYSSPLYMEMDE